jgi:hypothetical protein
MTNPYLPAASQAITNQVNQNLQQQQLPGINSGAIAAGGFGGSRQGIAQGLAIGQTNQALGNSLANLNFNAWNQGQQNQLQSRQIDNSYNLSMGNLGLGQMQANQNFYTNQRGQDLQQAGLGANLVQSGNSGLQQGGQGLYNLGLTQQQAPLNALQSYAQLLQPFTGLNQSSSQTTPGASTVGSALGGALTAAQIWQLLSGGK